MRLAVAGGMRLTLGMDDLSRILDNLDRLWSVYLMMLLLSVGLTIVMIVDDVGSRWPLHMMNMDGSW